jgi:hypothetical protein
VRWWGDQYSEAGKQAKGHLKVPFGRSVTGSALLIA